MTRGLYYYIQFYNKFRLYSNGVMEEHKNGKWVKVKIDKSAGKVLFEKLWGVVCGMSYVSYKKWRDELGLEWIEW